MQNTTTSINIPPAIDADGDNLTYDLVLPPSSGTIENCMMGTSDLLCDYVAEENFFGDVEFKITASDGQGTSEIQTVTLTVLPPSETVKEIFAGGNTSCALFTDGTLKCWGDNRFGQLGLGHTNNIGDDEIPVEAGIVSVGFKVKSVALGAIHTCALSEMGEVKCWGENIFWPTWIWTH